MIEKVKMTKYGSAVTLEQIVQEVARKQDEIINKVNELDIKLHTAKFFTSDQEKAIKQLLKLLGDD